MLPTVLSCRHVTNEGVLADCEKEEAAKREEVEREATEKEAEAALKEYQAE